ncbi:AAA family ATPase [Butyribacter sp.]|uniref:AAA family ATPase n=1 Tax=Butyribacter sp. TaxID=2822465 RepID=UPI002A9E07B6|nr:AAA family ATPase [Butyribacter sp.]
MPKIIGIGKQRYDRIIENNLFYIDKTMFIKEWWENQDDVTLITRPRRFGKTLNMDMLKCFFSNEYKDRGDLFERLDIWKEEKYREIQGTYPVIFLSFAKIKQNTYEDAVAGIKRIICDEIQKYIFLKDWDGLAEEEKTNLKNITYAMDDVTAQEAIASLSNYLSRYYGKNVIILLDEYDTPMQEAYVNGYWEELVSFTRSFFNATFKSNMYLERAIMTGITRVSKESMFSDLNNLVVITTSSKDYATAFGFTEEEVFHALDEYGLSDKKCDVKEWYDGFVFGGIKDIYNPWSIINFLKYKELKNYWADTSSNDLISKLIKTGSAGIKETMEKLIDGKTIEKKIDEQIIYNQLEKNENSIWSLLLASGYLKAVSIDVYISDEIVEIYKLAITNNETKSMFRAMIKEWFSEVYSEKKDFLKALILGDVDAMNQYMNDIALETFSSFDVAGRENSRVRPENFYHGFVLGLMVEKRDDYIIKSNKESGFGRYDVMMIPRNVKTGNLPAMILEFKVMNSNKEKTLEETVSSALAQIEEKKYDTELINAGVKKENIRHYGFAFEGKKVLIGTDE